MFKKILIANRGDNAGRAGVAAQAHVRGAHVMPKPTCLVREAHTGNLAAIEVAHV